MVILLLLTHAYISYKYLCNPPFVPQMIAYYISKLDAVLSCNYIKGDFKKHLTVLTLA